MESQHVRLLTEGYLRGWLDFKYPHASSHFRERLVLDYIEEQRLCSLLEHKLLIETVLRSTLPSKAKNVLEPIFSTKDSLVGLKLPLYLAKDKISKVSDNKLPELKNAEDALQQMKAILDQINGK